MPSFLTRRGHCQSHPQESPPPSPEPQGLLLCCQPHLTPLGEHPVGPHGWALSRPHPGGWGASGTRHLLPAQSLAPSGWYDCPHVTTPEVRGHGPGPGRVGVCSRPICPPGTSGGQSSQTGRPGAYSTAGRRAPRLSVGAWAGERGAQGDVTSRPCLSWGRPRLSALFPAPPRPPPESERR